MAANNDGGFVVRADFIDQMAALEPVDRILVVGHLFDGGEPHSSAMGKSCRERTRQIESGDSEDEVGFYRVPLN